MSCSCSAAIAIVTASVWAIYGHDGMVGCWGWRWMGAGRLSVWGYTVGAGFGAAMVAGRGTAHVGQEASGAFG